ncbi:tyrosyl-DNA phosphodiesterase-domain-containing protein [Bombardia bombarda]|uniref:Tyrosyl-DNA phosphodiesterase-domain-containing protein n=1 Tax=Bombardia bombarda TaxID=252184 RepID=A0AA39XP18_9PEZI|nr:tyrosyl-DNA phosphodiesterase-domain-containing protein [Bombardia bombarda]
MDHLSPSRPKKRRLSSVGSVDEVGSSSSSSSNRNRPSATPSPGRRGFTQTLLSFTRAISPPRSQLSKRSGVSESPFTKQDSPTPTPTPKSASAAQSFQAEENVPPSNAFPPAGRLVKSPFQLTKARDLPSSLNRDAISLSDILNDPLISECWEFNYLHDINFLMAHFDPDVRHLVKVHIVHGFWKREDPQRLELEAQASRWQQPPNGGTGANITLHSAFLPEMFGTHHSKMMILLRHDDTAQVVIHTANMIARDWTNMTQAAWLSPRLPLLKEKKRPASISSTASTASTPDLSENEDHDDHDRQYKTGSGEKFKVDLLNYLRAYDRRRITCKLIADELARYDFSAVRGSLIASVPGRHSIRDESPTRWGWAAAKEALKAVPVTVDNDDVVQKRPEIVVQISSIATLGPTDNWLRNTLFSAFSGSKNKGSSAKPDFKVMFPTPDEIRRSLDGYESGRSIHTKISSSQQAKQLAYLRPMFCHWANDSPGGADIEGDDIQEAGRERAAPHIKTYIRYSSGGATNKPEVTTVAGNHPIIPIDWALVTSANLSKQAWGEEVNASSGEIRVSSYEIGVLVWPALFGEDAVMTGTFLTDTPVSTPPSLSLKNDKGDDGSDSPISRECRARTVVGLRIPYNLPLQPYGSDEKPWVAVGSYDEPDWMGKVWRRE